MKERVIGILKTYVLFVCLFVLQKPLFMLFYSQFYDSCSWLDWFRVIAYGLPLDISVAAYLTVVPALLYLVSVWVLSTTLRRIWCGYYILVSTLLSVLFIIDLVLYEYWGFRLDTTPFFYFFSSPKDTLASADAYMLFAGFGAMVCCTVLYYCIFYIVLLRRHLLLRMRMPYRCLRVSAVLLLCTALLFVPMRGGFTVSTMNTGKVYFSTDMRLNHAAINPVFSLLESVFKQNNFVAQYRFMDDDYAGQIFTGMTDPEVHGSVCEPEQLPDSMRTLLTTQRPDILFVVLEGFSSHLMSELGGEPDVAVHLDSLCRESVLFTNFYANSFRTDRGLVAILSGYPAQPTTSIMKYPHKTQSMPSIAGSLSKAGYEATYYYGGDADFTNMRSYLKSSGFVDIICDKNFPISERLSKWGVHDHILFDRLIDDLQKEAADSLSEGEGRMPRFRVVQTSSSHEPFEVPYRRLANDRLNAFAYTDSCIGDFIQRFQRLPQWKNTLVVLIPDHLGAYPEGISNLDVARYHIPMLMLGGAVLQPRRIDVYGSQQDIAATLLAQMGLPHGEFTFSKDLMNPSSPHFAFFTVPDAFGLVTSTNRVVYDCQSDTPVVCEGPEAEKTVICGKAYLQKLYDDIAKR